MAMEDIVIPNPQIAAICDAKEQYEVTEGSDILEGSMTPAGPGKVEPWDVEGEEIAYFGNQHG